MREMLTQMELNRSQRLSAHHFSTFAPAVLNPPILDFRVISPLRSAESGLRDLGEHHS